jgi:hypothetical protein
MPDDVPKIPLAIEVVVAPAFADVVDPQSSVGARFREDLLAFVSYVAGQLGIPVEPSVDVAAATADESESALAYVVRIGGRPCEVARALGDEPDVAPERLAAEVAGAIAYNRDLLLVPEATERLVGEWTAQNPALAPTPSSIGELLTELVRRCRSVRPRPLDGALDPSSSSGEHLREGALAAAGLPSLEVFVGSDLESALAPDDEQAVRAYSKEISLSLASLLMKDLFFEELGLLLPDVAFHVDAGLGQGRFAIAINDVRLPPLDGLVPGEVMVNAPAETLAPIYSVMRRGVHPTQRTPTTILRADDAQLARLNEEGYTSWDPEGQIVLTLANEIRRNAGAFLAADVVTFHVNQLRESSSAVVAAAAQRLDAGRLVALLRALLDDHVSIKNLGGILEGVCAVNGSASMDQSRYRLVSPVDAGVWPAREPAAASAPDADAYADAVRRHLRGQISSSHFGSRGEITAIVTDPALETRLRTAESAPLDEAERSRLYALVEPAYEAAATISSSAVVVTNSEVRRALRRLLSRSFPSLLVVARDELLPGVNVKVVAQIEWA